MAHNLNFNEEKNSYSFFSAKEKAWHNLGTIVDNAVNSKQAISLAGLDFQVDKAPIFTNLNQENQSVIINEKFTTFRTDTNDTFGIVSGSYEIVQNADAFNFFDSIVGEGAAIYETAGCLNKGEVIFITAKLPDCIRVGKDDLIEQYLFLTSSHDGTGSIQAAFTPIRIVCNNTLNAALRTCSNKISIRHTANAKEKIEQAHKIMGISHVMFNKLNIIFNRMAKVSITDHKLKDLIARSLAPSKEVLNKIEANEELSTRFSNSIDKCLEYASSAESQLMDSSKGTVFGAYNAITGYFQNVKSYKSNDSKLKSILFGDVRDKGQIAFDLCLDLINN
jgi:phage/plasmid-like protein (TIGR03299 family)